MLAEDELVAAMEHERHRGLKIWKDAVTFASDIYRLTKTFPSEERFGLTSQLRRAAVSVASNIAEGSKRLEADNKNFLRYALGSLAEYDTELVIAETLGYGEYTKKLKSTIKALTIGISAASEPIASHCRNPDAL